MKIYSNNAENFLRNVKPGGLPAVLIYGPDLGAVRDNMKKLSARLLPGADEMALKEFSAEDIKNDPGLLLSEINAMNFFSERRVIIISNFIASIAETVTEAIANIPADLTIIITAEELGRESKLRKFFEDHKTLPAIICYKEDERSIKAWVAQKFRDAGVRVDADAMNFLSANLGEDKQITINEVEKILTYLGDQKTLSFEEAVQLLADSSELTVNDIAFAAALKDAAKLEKSLARAFAEQMNAVPIFRGVAWQFQRLITARLMVNNGMAVDAALNSLRPAVFFRQVDQFKNALRKWDEKALKKAMADLTEAELQAKSSTLDSDIICREALLKLVA